MSQDVQDMAPSPLLAKLEFNDKVIGELFYRVAEFIEATEGCEYKVAALVYTELKAAFNEAAKKYWFCIPEQHAEDSQAGKPATDTNL
jgi:hypothetical protein